jgi:hypothetical protein
LLSAAPIAIAPTTEATMIQAFFFPDIFPEGVVPVAACMSALNGGAAPSRSGPEPCIATATPAAFSLGEVFPDSARHGIEAAVTNEKQRHATIRRKPFMGSPFSAGLVAAACSNSGGP